MSTETLQKQEFFSELEKSIIELDSRIDDAKGDVILHIDLEHVLHFVNNLIDYGKIDHKNLKYQESPLRDPEYQDFIYRGLEIARKGTAKLTSELKKKGFSEEIDYIEIINNTKSMEADLNYVMAVEKGNQQRFKTKQTLKFRREKRKTENLRKEIWGENSDAEKASSYQGLFELIKSYTRTALCNYSLAKQLRDNNSRTGDQNDQLSELEEKIRSDFSMGNEEFEELFQLMSNPESLNIIAGQYRSFQEQMKKIGIELDNYLPDIEAKIEKNQKSRKGLRGMLTKVDDRIDTIIGSILSNGTIDSVFDEHYKSKYVALNNPTIVVPDNETNHNYLAEEILDAYTGGLSVLAETYKKPEKKKDDKPVSDDIKDEEVIDPVLEELSKTYGDNLNVVAFKEYVTSKLADCEEIPAVYHATTNNVSKVGYNVDRAWGYLKRSVPIFEKVEEYGIDNLAKMVTEGKSAMLKDLSFAKTLDIKEDTEIKFEDIKDYAMDIYFNKHDKRKFEEKIGDAVAFIYDTLKEINKK